MQNRVWSASPRKDLGKYKFTKFNKVKFDKKRLGKLGSIK